MKAKWSSLLNLAFYTYREIQSLLRQPDRSTGTENVKCNIMWIVLNSLHSLKFKKDTDTFIFSHIVVIDLLLQRSYWGLFAKDFHTVPI